MASKRRTPAPSTCARKSGEVSTSTVVALSGPPPSPIRRTSSEQRERRLRGSFGSHAPQSPSERGTPVEEPHPNIVISSRSLTDVGSDRTSRRRRPRFAPPRRSETSLGPPQVWREHAAETLARCAGHGAASEQDRDSRFPPKSAPPAGRGRPPSPLRQL